MDFDDSCSVKRIDDLASSQSDFHGFSSVEENISTADEHPTETEKTFYSDSAEQTETGETLVKKSNFQSLSEESESDDDFSYDKPKRRKIESENKKDVSKPKTECKVCKKKYIHIVQHLLKMPTCKEIYGDEFEELREQKKSAYYKNYYHKNAAKKRKSTAEYKSQHQDEFKQKTECKVCKKKYVDLIQHLLKMSTCKEIYGDEFEKLRKQSIKKKNAYDKNYYHKNADKKRKVNAEYKAHH